MINHLHETAVAAASTVHDKNYLVDLGLGAAVIGGGVGLLAWVVKKTTKTNIGGGGVLLLALAIVLGGGAWYNANHTTSTSASVVAPGPSSSMAHPADTTAKAGQ